MTYVTDPIADLLTRIRNAQGARRPGCLVPWSRVKQQVCDLLVREGWLLEAKKEGEGIHQHIVIRFVPQKTLELKRVSKPGRRQYISAADLKPVLQGFGIAVLTTSKGIMTDAEARKQRVGGEILCTIW
ncbi:30S ribosomal protein S8 [Candidatus Peregrinibacteria bacterium CG10_big_fil_rev_8_21_14_0_10_49_16]|nr:MAG: 30S ribosomal protein S8 [Candidatus Peregrinibacteria bacterium CG22_combo_CG10-13_8_21_14_all_49_11]PIR51837.1 MAG: 30S ribosomal protein S8 [Candidatus Peregrinibacteria bacterium CG10_big_fil_rev_8_21_14_0_10_49_16]